jgi:hypothetical protein
VWRKDEMEAMVFMAIAATMLVVAFWGSWFDRSLICIPGRHNVRSNASVIMASHTNSTTMQRGESAYWECLSVVLGMGEADRDVDCNLHRHYSSGVGHPLVVL